LEDNAIAKIRSFEDTGDGVIPGDTCLSESEMGNSTEILVFHSIW
jgi:hypothetical protein